MASQAQKRSQEAFKKAVRVCKGKGRGPKAYRACISGELSGTSGLGRAKRSKRSKRSHLRVSHRR